MGNRYVIKRENVTPVAAQDILTLKSAASRRLRVISVRASGVGASSAPQSLVISRVTTVGITPGGVLTPDKADHNDQPAAAFTVPTTWATQPVVNTHGAVLSWNALGGADRFDANQFTKGMFEARNAEEISIRPGTGPTPQAMSLTVVVEED